MASAVGLAVPPAAALAPKAPTFTVRSSAPGAIPETSRPKTLASTSTSSIALCSLDGSGKPKCWFRLCKPKLLGAFREAPKKSRHFKHRPSNLAKATSQTGLTQGRAGLPLSYRINICKRIMVLSFAEGCIWN